MQADNTVEKVDHSLTLEEDLKLHIRGWKTQKIGAVLILILMILAALGLFGEGLLSARKIVKEGVSVEYEYFLRYQKEMDIAFRLSDQGDIRVAVPLQYLDRFKVARIVPEPNESVISGDYVIYTFRAEKKGKKLCRFYLQAQKPGSVKGSWKVNQQHFEMSHFIYP
ncbi:hypothetical protein [Olivibacter sp. XZL3]|uniref:hypothetical protein n=1 Tax=Olivibacter sp. XZL3 TaxID=1735116 RepID=UPI00106496A5|nr:hypothetical protein [Olivibacter sp. XZL3]